MLEVVETVMGPEVRASMVNARDVPPHTGVRMPFHMDSDKGRVRDEKGYNAATAIWMLDEFSAGKRGDRLRARLASPWKKPKGGSGGFERFASGGNRDRGSAGDVLVFNGHCWHAGRPNETDGHRRAVLVHYLRADVPRPENRRQHVDADQAAALSSRERELLGLDEE